MKTMTGVVVSQKTAQTAIVLVEWQWQHPLYKKFVKRSKRFACHLDTVVVKTGDTVVVTECRPVSKTKKFRVSAKVEAK